MRISIPRFNTKQKYVLAINLEVLTKKNAMEVVQMEINCGSNLVLVVVVKTQKGPKQKKFYISCPIRCIMKSFVLIHA